MLQRQMYVRDGSGVHGTGAWMPVRSGDARGYEEGDGQQQIGWRPAKKHDLDILKDKEQVRVRNLKFASHPHMRKLDIYSISTL